MSQGPQYLELGRAERKLGVGCAGLPIGRRVPFFTQAHPIWHPPQLSNSGEKCCTNGETSLKVTAQRHRLIKRQRFNDWIIARFSFPTLLAHQPGSSVTAVTAERVARCKPQRGAQDRPARRGDTTNTLEESEAIGTCSYRKC